MTYPTQQLAAMPAAAFQRISLAPCRRIPNRLNSPKMMAIIWKQKAQIRYITKESLSIYLWIAAQARAYVAAAVTRGMQKQYHAARLKNDFLESTGLLMVSTMPKNQCNNSEMCAKQRRVQFAEVIRGQQLMPV